ncbi:MAG: CBS domain-containing protein [Neisseriaceae bacterium]|nr:MAG: CBS domain-containing protein [Neisseriaceae bacterium]
MDFSWVLDLNILIGFITLLVLELVLGIDNLVFVAIISNKAKLEHRDLARISGLSLAIVIRIIMLALASYLISMTKPLFTFANMIFSAKDMLMIAGGLFLIYKTTTELHEKIDEQVQYKDTYQTRADYTPTGIVILQIILLDAVFSIDSVITAVGMINHITVAMLSVTIAMIFMIMGSKHLTEFINKHPTVVILCLGFLLLIGLSLILEGFHISVPKGYIYAAILFSIMIEILNQISSKNRKENTYTSVSWRRRTIDSVLGMMGVRESILASATKNGEVIEDQSIFEDNEKHMIRRVLTLAEKPIEAIMTPRMEIEKLNISKSVEEQRNDLKDSPYSRLIVVGKAGIEEPLGYISKKDILTELLESEKYDINKLIKQPLFIPETATVLTALELFRNSLSDIGLVVDEFGTVLGLVSMKNIMESIAGEFPEEYEQTELPSIQTNPDQSITVEGSLDYDQLTQIIHIPPLPEDSEFHSVAGLIMEELQQIPNIGDSIEYYGYTFKVLEKNGQKIERVKIKPYHNKQ